MIFLPRYMYCFDLITKVCALLEFPHKGTHNTELPHVPRHSCIQTWNSRYKARTHAFKHTHTHWHMYKTRTQVNGDWSARRLAVIPDLLSVNNIWLSWCETGTIKLKFTLIFRYSGHRLREVSACESWETITVILFLKKTSATKEIDLPVLSVLSENTPPSWNASKWEKTCKQTHDSRLISDLWPL